MRVKNYEITDPVAGFEEGDILDVTARFGDWHVYSLKLEPRTPRPGSRTIVVTESEPGFSEEEILDETARIGDWHEYELKFDPVDSSESSSGRLTVSMDELEEIAQPVDATS